MQREREIRQTSWSQIINLFPDRWDRLDAVWFGLNDIEEESKFTFSDGSPMSYQNWFDTFPKDNYKFSDCALIPLEKSANFQWKDVTCGEELPFICRIKLNKMSPQALDDIVNGNWVSWWFKKCCYYFDRCLLKRPNTNRVLSCKIQ